MMRSAGAGPHRLNVWEGIGAWAQNVTPLASSNSPAILRISCGVRWARGGTCAYIDWTGQIDSCTKLGATVWRRFACGGKDL